MMLNNTLINQLSQGDLAAPAWFTPQPGQANSPAIALIESPGPNFQDLLAAAMLALDDAAVTARIAIGNDERNADAARSVALLATNWGANVVIGHFGASTALPASRVYGQHDIVYLAPGTSANNLCNLEANTTWQFFARDCEQVDCLKSAALDVSNIVIIAQTANYGEDLAIALCQAIANQTPAPSVIRHTLAIEALAQATLPVSADTDLCYLFGSKEFVKKILGNAAIAKANMPLIFADECFGAAFFDDERIARRSRIAYPEMPSDQLIDRSAEQVKARAAALLGRRPGAYFDSSYVAIRAFLSAWQASPQGDSSVIGAQLRARKWDCTFGALELDDQRRITGHQWKLHPATRV